MRSHSLLVRPAMTSSMPGKSGLHPQRSYDLRWLRLSGKTWRWTAASLPLEPSHLAATRLVGGCSTAPPAERHLLDPSVAVPQVTEPDPSPIRTYAGSAVAAAAQIGWQRSADGSEAMAVAQIRWHRTRCYLASCPIYTFCLLLVSDLDRPFCHPVVMISPSVTPMHHPMSMGSSANCRPPSRCRA